MKMQIKKISLLLLILSVFAVSIGNAQTKKKTTKKKPKSTQVSAEEMAAAAKAIEDSTAAAQAAEAAAQAAAALPPAAATASTVDPNAVKTEVPKLPWVQEITGKRMIMGYEPIREADVFWWKTVWRVIDLREKINLHFKWPKAPFIQIMLDAINGGKAQVYSGMDDDFATPIDPKEALSVAGGSTDYFTSNYQ